MLVHVVREFHTNYPDIKISILIPELHQPLFYGIDVNFIANDFKGRHKGLCGLWRLAREIREQGVDCVADMHNVTRALILRNFFKLYSIPVARLLKGKVSKWMRMDGGCQEVTMPLKHTVERYCKVLHHLGFEIDLPHPAQKVQRPNPMPYERGEQRWIGVAPFSIHEGKRYPQHLVRDLIAELSAKYDRVFLHSRVTRFVDFMDEMERTYDNVERVAGRIELAQEIDLIANEDCLISADNYAMHLASLVSTPNVSIWGATHPSLGFSGYGCDTEGYMQLNLTCRPCSTYGNKKCRMHDYRCLNDITPESVVERVEYIVNKDK